MFPGSHEDTVVFQFLNEQKHILHSDVIGTGSCLRRCPRAFYKHLLRPCLLHQATATVPFSLSGQSARAEIFF